MEPIFGKRIAPRRLAITSVLLGAGVLAFVSRASADNDGHCHGNQHQFTEADLRGRYAASFQGQIPGAIIGEDGLIPVATEGVFFANGAGRITSAKRTLSLAGNIIPQRFSCTYDVDPDGTGSADCLFEDGSPPESYDFVLEEDGGVRFISTNPGYIVLGSAKH